MKFIVINFICNSDTLDPHVNLPVIVPILTEISCLDLMSNYH